MPDFSGTVIIFTSDFDVMYPVVFSDKEFVENSRLTQHIVGNWLHVSTVHAVTIMAVSLTRKIQIYSPHTITDEEHCIFVANDVA